MSIADLQRIKALEAEAILIKARLEKVESWIWGQQLADDAEDAEFMSKRKVNRPRKEVAA